MKCKGIILARDSGARLYLAPITAPLELLLDAIQFISPLEAKQGLKVAYPEEVAFRKQWINAIQLEKFAQQFAKNGYGKYLQRLLKKAIFR